MLENLTSRLSDILYILPAVLIAIIFHETAHGLVSHLLGDPTPKETNRLTLNPLQHLDPVGTLCLVLFRFGWAKPVRVDPRYYRNPRLGMVYVALAGPFANFIIAFLTGFIHVLLWRFFPLPFWLDTIFNYIIIINAGLGLFNLIPIPPLDGSKIIGALMPEKYYMEYLRYEGYGVIILLVLLASGLLDNFLNNIITSLVRLIYNSAVWVL